MEVSNSKIFRFVRNNLTNKLNEYFRKLGEM